MANKKSKSEITPIVETVATLKTKVQEVNDVALNTTETVIEKSIEAGKDWQKLMAKGLKNADKLAANQQDIVFETLEGIKKQALQSRKRWRKLFNFEFDFSPSETLAELPGAKAVKRATKQVENQVETAKAVARSVAKEATKTANKTAKKATATAKAATKNVAKKTKPVVKSKTTTTKTTAAAKTVKVEKVLDTKVGTLKVTGTTTVKNDQKDDLKKINGIGPKVEQLLNVAGIKTFKQLAEAKDADLRAVIDAAGPRFRAQDPTAWNNQAKDLLKK